MLRATSHRMKDVLRNTLAAMTGALTGMLLIILTELLSGRLFPAPAGLNWQDKAAVAAFIQSLPIQASLVLLGGYAVAVFAGAYVAGRFSFGGGTRQAVMVTLLFLVATALNVGKIPHPTWFVGANFLLIAVAGWLAVTLLSRRAARAD